MTHLIIFYLVLVFTFECQGSSDSIEDIFQSLNSKVLKVSSLNETQSYESKTYSLSQKGLTWSPSADISKGSKLLNESNKINSDNFYGLEILNESYECKIQSFRDALISQLNPESVIKDFWKRCESTWRQEDYNPLTHSQEILRTQFEPTKHPAVRVVEWNLPSKLKVRGLLFFKGPTKRPLVILRTGIFSQLRTTVAERFLQMQLFEEGPYHVLLLPSTTGADFIKDNHSFTLGGFDEGLQTQEILTYLENPEEPLHKFISKVHLVGISLGGHGILFTHLLEQNNSKSMIDRTLLLCPAVDLQGTFQEQKKDFLTNFLVNRWYSLRLNPLREELGILKTEKISDFVDKKISSYEMPKINWKFKNLKLPVRSQPFWFLNDFWSWMPSFDFKKTFVIWNKVDPIVPPTLNAKILSSKYNAPESSMMELPRGLHCSLSTAYQWPLISMTMRGYLDPDLIKVKIPPWQSTFLQSHKIKKINLRDIDLKNHFLKLILFIQFENPFRPPQVQTVTVPETITDQFWVLSKFDLYLKQSILRELTSRLEWVQTKNELTVSIQ